MASRVGSDQYGPDGTFEPAPQAAAVDPVSGVTDGRVPKARSGDTGTDDVIAGPAEATRPDSEAVQRTLDALLDEGSAQQHEGSVEGSAAAEQAEDEGEQPEPAEQAEPVSQDTPQGPRAWPAKPTGELVRMAWRPVQNRLAPAGLRKRKRPDEYPAQHDQRTGEQAETEAEPAAEESREQARPGIPAGAVFVVLMAIAFVVVAYFMVASFVDSITSLFG